jgi:hypothetical protein
LTTATIKVLTSWLIAVQITTQRDAALPNGVLEKRALKFTFNGDTFEEAALQLRLPPQSITRTHHHQPARILNPLSFNFILILSIQ